MHTEYRPVRENARQKSDRLLALVLAIALASLWFVTKGPFGLADPPGSSPEHLLEVSIKELISRPRDFHGKYVRVMGFYCGEFEGTALYQTLDDWGWDRYDKGIWVNVLPPFRYDRLFYERPEIFNDQHVLAEGRFNAEQRGHMGLWPASLDVTHMKILKKKDK
jgi:hypothetical protein